MGLNDDDLVDIAASITATSPQKAGQPDGLMKKEQVSSPLANTIPSHAATLSGEDTECPMQQQLIPQLRISCRPVLLSNPPRRRELHWAVNRLAR